MKQLIYSLLFVFILAACKDEYHLEDPQGAPDTQLYQNIYSISVEEALANLEAFMGDMTTPSSRSGRKVASISPIEYRSNHSRSTEDSIDCENLLYVANFEDEQGYAILAADKRISTGIIAVVDEGYLSDATVYTALELASEERIILEDYPTTGEGFFTTEETGDEVFINPNTVVLYIDSIGDTLVGNFSLDNIGAIDENGNPVDSLTTEVSITTPELITTTLCVNYATEEIRASDRFATSQTTETDLAIDGGPTTPTITDSTFVSDWSVTQSVTPILSQFAYWHQDTPFNDLYPERRKFILFGTKRKAPAGCFPLAVAKILTHFEYPNVYTHNGYTINWTELKKDYDSTEGALSAAHLLKSISSACGSWYFYQGTFTFPSNVTSFMRGIGIQNAHSYNYKFERVTAMLDQRLPLIIYSIPGINIFNSHSWIIDGYKIKERTITTKTYKSNVLTSSTSETETSEMVHCDFGWKRQMCNGYYVSGIFKLNDENVELDPGVKPAGSTNYNNYLKIITYDSL